MSDTCIVCLGELGEGAPEPLGPLAVDSLPRPSSGDGGIAQDAALKSPQQSLADDLAKIAHLLPCGHNLHNECLKPWVERANSCPICRQKFNVVELMDVLGGPAVSSYVVEDRVQVPDVDPLMFADDGVEGVLSQPCPICGDDDNEEVLLLCDGCDVPSHTYCLGLDSVPSGPWFCHQCEGQQAASSEPARPRNHRRTRAEQRRERSRSQANAVHWARVWQTVWDQIGFDLDFPFDDDEDTTARQRRRRRRELDLQRREFRAWERRFQVAQRQGGAQTFRDTAPALLEIRRGWPSRPRPRLETPEPESLDEIRAWNAFERAREIENGSSSNRLKRKSPTASPVEPEPEPAQPERKLKRPRTRRPEELADLLERGESSRSVLSSVSRAQTDSSGPSFLQSLLKEVEDASAGNRTNGAFRRTIPIPTPTDMTSPRPASPALSPISSNRSSPRPSSATPPPYCNGPTSPSSVSSDPIFSSPEFSPTFSPCHDSETNDQSRRPRQLTRLQQSRDHSASSSSPSRHRSNESSPTRVGLSLSTKSELQKMVRAALKPHYRQKLVSKDEYTDINRRISRKLYELVGSADELNPESRAKWEKVANEEVNKAVAHIKETRTHETSESSGAASS
ncbi:hypothetical protein VTO42DRAFT_3092 [Malbranchea cinnamomea]